MTCTAACRQAEGSLCHCPCDGVHHGEEALAQQLVLWVAATAPAQSDREPASEPPEPVPDAEPVPAESSATRPRRTRQAGCDGCGRPWAEVGPYAADVESGRLCSDCLDALWKAAEAEEVRRAPAPVRARAAKGSRRPRRAARRAS